MNCAMIRLSYIMYGNDIVEQYQVILFTFADITQYVIGQIYII